MATNPRVLTDRQHQHLAEIQTGMAELIGRKYARGAQEHGGNLWENKNLAQELLAELADASSYGFSIAQMMTPGVVLVMQERRRQLVEEGWYPEHDDAHPRGWLARAAACYAVHDLEADGPFRKIQVLNGDADAWPFGVNWDKRRKHDRIRRLQIAGALIVAELERELRYEAGRQTGEMIREELNRG